MALGSSADNALGKFKLALKDFETAKKARPNDKDAVAKYNECLKMVRQLSFERAIAVESSQKKPSDMIELDKIGGCVQLLCGESPD